MEALNVCKDVAKDIPDIVTNNKSQIDAAYQVQEDDDINSQLLHTAEQVTRMKKMAILLAMMVVAALMAGVLVYMVMTQ